MSDSTRWFVLLSIAFVGGIIYLLAPVLTPFMVAAVLAYIGDPLVDKLERYRVPRTAAVTLVFIGLTVVAVGLLIVVTPMLEKQIAILVQKLPGYIETLQTVVLPWLSETLGLEKLNIDVNNLQESLKQNWQSAGGVVANIVASVTRSGMALFTGLANLMLVIIVAFYLLRDWDKLVKYINEILPRKSEPVITLLAKQSDEVLGAFFKGQLLVMLALTLIYSIGLGIVGLDLAVLIGLLAGLVSFVPYLGFIVGILAAGIAAIMQFHDVTYLLYVFIVFGIGQALEGMLLTPLLVGDRIGLHPVAVIFAVLTGGQLFGFFGILSALPVAAVIAVVLRYLHQQYKQSELYKP